MATARKPGSRPGLIHCEHCGEEYSASYRRCPFCDEYDEYEDVREPARRTPPPRSGGGKRLAKSKRRGGGYTRVSPVRVIAYIISLAVILFALWIVVAKIMPLVKAGNVTGPDEISQSDVSASPSVSAPEESPEISPDVSPDVSPETSEPAADPTPDTQTSPVVSAAPSGANGLSLSKSEFSFTAKYPDPVTLKVTFVPAGTTDTVTWSSSNTNVVTVDANGKVSPGAQKGSATVTATLPNGVSQSCTVHNQVGGSSSSGGTTTTADTSSAKLNKTDFTFYTAGEKTQLSVSGYSGTVTWSSSNTSVATVSAEGVCKAVGSGKCTITATLADGTALTAIARCSLS